MARHPARGHCHRVDIPHHPSEADDQQHCTQWPRDQAVPSQDTTAITPTTAFIREAPVLRILSRTCADGGRITRHLLGHASESKSGCQRPVPSSCLPPSLCGTRLALTRDGRTVRVQQTWGTPEKSIPHLQPPAPFC